MYLNDDGTLGRDELADDLEQAVHGYGLWEIDEVMAWLAGRLRDDPRHPDVPALLLAAFAARFPVVYRVRDAAVFDALLTALAHAAATLTAEGCGTEGGHVHPPVEALHESEDTGGPEGLTQVMRLLHDRDAWDEEVEADGDPFANPVLADFDGWRCPAFLAVLAAHTADELRLWGADRFPAAPTPSP
ncbi:hypothetical protein [Actinomadura algeriensis]|uniref:Uncharacterized protein n=1 Tax=Actinomadura algeriensis TaxID=1679523 RepID=A0ABR9JUL4_9ACTN|nr:hypothetical protein [Actinomadura algeriensis]MBE1534262.1 hypothetical protein [Actinomadura algeriensis]